MSEQVAIDYESLITNVSPLQNVICGDQINEFLNYKKSSNSNPKGLNATGIFNLRNSSIDILSHCNPHNAINNVQATHLVVGYVQSGKTMSFTAVSKLALDNHYRVIVYLTGVTNNLLDQTSNRLETDLICGNDLNYKKFKFYVNPNRDSLDDLSSSLNIKGSILIIPILKHYAQINIIARLFNTQKFKQALGNETVLIIDDEADQASLNTNGYVNTDKKQEEKLKSQTYSAILNLRSCLPGNSYIQYTATPQANILIDAIDVLSPKTHTLLEPGDGYDGGKQFFGMDTNGRLYNGGLIEVIPESDVLNKRKLNLKQIPKSLKRALIQHIWATYLIVYWQKKELYLSMMVHVDVTEEWNTIFRDWIRDTLEAWSELLKKDISDLDKQILIAQLKKEYNEAVKFYDNYPPFETALSSIQEVIDDRKVYLVIGSSKESHDIKWKNHSMNILVGANMLNRGFTINNLATTYMPRFPKEPNADTIEQRCRFFGYKEDYIQSCRVFLPQTSIDAYKDYIQSEEELRNTLRKSKSIEEFGHRIMLSPTLHPTRKNVLPNKVITSRLRGSHEFQSFKDDSIINYNIKLVEAFLAKHSKDLSPYVGKFYDFNKYEGQRKHKCFSVSLSEAETFIRNFRSCDYTDNNLRISTARYLYYLSTAKSLADTKVLFIMMGCNELKGRTLNKATDKITTHLYNGPDKSGTYPGDLAIKSPNEITVQIHHVKLENIGKEAYALQIFYPENLATSFISTK